MLATAWDQYLIAPETPKIDMANLTTKPPKGYTNENDNKEALAEAVEQLYKRQRVLQADNRYAVLCVFQAMDAAGKDSTIRKVFSGVNPAGVKVHPFKGPSAEELSHDFLWRIHQRMPARGEIGVFNRSHYEEVLVVRVNPSYLDGQRLPHVGPLPELWPARLSHINNFEKYAAEQGTIILKFFLNVSREEQHRRFRDRIDEEKSRWKFQASDLDKSKQWQDYMNAYRSILEQTSRPHAPWYAIPADDKPFMRRAVAEIILSALERLDIRYPEASKEELDEMAKLRDTLIA